MIYTLTHRVTLPDDDAGTALREAVSTLVQSTEGASLISSAVARDQQCFKVTGVDMEAREAFSQQIDADSAEDAAAQVASDTRIVASVDEVTSP